MLAPWNPSGNNDFTYNAIGNITSKLGVGNYSYGAGNAGPHAVTNAGGISYSYDSNGRMLSGGGRTVSYTPFGKPNHMARGSNSVHIAYGPNKNRLERVDAGSKSATTTYVGGVYEKELSGGYTTHTHYLGDFALYIAKSSTSMNEERMVYLHRDHIGSIAAKTDMVATANANAEFMANGPWGLRTEDKWNGVELGDNFVPEDTARGFTDHEHLDGVGLIHMNGRVYEPELGRFLSPDPFVQAPENTQSLNRYSYVFNNPLSYTDPSGFFSDDGGARCDSDPMCTTIRFSGGISGRDAAASLGLEGDISDYDFSLSYKLSDGTEGEIKNFAKGFEIFNFDLGSLIRGVQQDLNKGVRLDAAKSVEKQQVLNTQEGSTTAVSGQEGDWQLQLASNGEVGSAILDSAKDKIVDKAFENLAPAKINVLRGFFKQASGAAGKAESLGTAGNNLLKATFNNGLNDVRFYRTLNTSPTGRSYYTDRIVPWGRVDWRGFDPGGNSKPIDVLGNFLNHDSKR